MKNFMNYSLAAEPVSARATQSAQTVRRLIRSLKSCQYFRNGQWTADPNLAEHFPDAGKVVDACVRYHLVDVELVLQRVGEPSGIFDMHLRLLDQPAGAPDGAMPAAA
jgi:hypothetical protein